ncbi:hypothetical protein HAX54_008893 [Datura stramonium]|uniref:Uncharacterized protein n=1 Tax=Datura stramonium TaxID=4076 RepID=A0ABS8TE75_DATST|nr:hypothetical protein [Datura stramonium]
MIERGTKETHRETSSPANIAADLTLVSAARKYLKLWKLMINKAACQENLFKVLTKKPEFYCFASWMLSIALCVAETEATGMFGHLIPVRRGATCESPAFYRCPFAKCRSITSAWAVNSGSNQRWHRQFVDADLRYASAHSTPVQ